MLPFPKLDGSATAILAPGRPNLAYGELNHLLSRLAAQLLDFGLSGDDRVVLVTPNGPEAATAFLAISSVAQCAPLNPGYRDAEFDYYLKDLRPRLVIHTGDGPAAAAARLGIPTARMVLDPAQPAGVFYLPDLPDAGTVRVGERPHVALLLHTSGTTSRPKLVPLTWANLLESAANIHRTLQLTPADRCLNVMPLFHIHGLLAALLSTLRAGGSIVCTPGLIAPSFFDWMDTFAPTWYTAVPTMHQSILARAPGHPESIRRSVLRLVRSSSAPLPIAVMRELEATFGVPVIEAYGMTEAAHQMASNQLPPAVRKPGSVGCAAGPEVSVRDAQGSAVAAGREGHICIRGANVTPGYLANEAANVEAFRHGWFYTGDLGRMDEDGHLFLTGRSKEILNRGGEKISPREIDEVLMEHAAVRQCLTFALPDSQLGEEVGVVVVLREQHAASEMDLQHYAAARLADFKVPRRVFALSEIPTGPTGKLQRIGLAERLGITLDSWKPQAVPVTVADPDAAAAVNRIMCEVLDVNDLAPGRGFFDAGGDSLLATALIARLEQEFGGTLTMVDLFRDSSAEAIAAQLAHAAPARGGWAAPASSSATTQLSAGQVRLWLHEQFAEDNLASQNPKLFEIRGDLSPRRVHDALLRIVERHEPLRTVIDNDRGTPRARLRAAAPLPWVVHDWSGAPPQLREGYARELCVRDAAQPFQLDSDLMLRASLHRLDEGRWWLLVVLHHAASDGWSAQLLREELQLALDGRPLPPLPATYSDFARWQASEIAGERLERAKAYWTTRLEGAPPVLDLPLEFSRPAIQTHRGHAVGSLLPPSMTAELRALGRQERATLFMALLAGWTVLLSRYAGATDISVGTPVAGRGKVEFEKLIGLFMNTLVLRTRLDGDPSFTGVLARVRETCIEAWDHDLPFEQLLQTVPHERSLSHSPFFQVYFQLRNFPRAAASEVTPVIELEADFDVAPADLNLEITETAAGLRCRLSYNTAIFTERFAQSMLQHYQALLLGAVANPDAPISRLPVMTAAELEMLTVRRLPPQLPRASGTVVQMFEEQAAVRGRATALLYRDQSMTYEDLNRKANMLARAFIDAGVGPESIVILLMKRSPDWVVALLATAKAGGAYMGLEPDYPPALVRDLITRSRAVLVVTDEASRGALDGIATPVMVTADLTVLLTGRDHSDLPPRAAPENLAHVFFTSGSTGKPKGVTTEHRHLAAFLAGFHWMRSTDADTCLQFTSVTFDPGAAEVWAPLTSGGRCAIAADGLDDPPRLAQWIADHRVTMAFLSASVFNTIIDEAPELLKPIRRVLIGGEALSATHIRRAQELLPRTELINGYGPTETTIYYTGYRIPRPFDPAAAAVPIGRPLDNGRAYIVDRHGELLPDGLPGELWLGGDTVGRGYLHDPELTAAAFVAGPVAGAGRVYRTGDSARWRPDGEIEFLGRVDQQVKVRGVRIELGEIESVLREHPAVRHACVVAVPHPGIGNVLSGFVELQAGGQASVDDLRAFLDARLPHQMVPARLVVAAGLPLTASGKIDRKALKATATQGRQPAIAVGRQPQILPTDEPRAPSAVVDRLANIWRTVLNVSEVRPEDSFFALGGHSLLAVRLAFQIEREFGTRLTLVALFEAPTLQEMAGLLGGGERQATAAPSASSLPPMLCVAAGPLFRSFADAIAPRCRFHPVPAPEDRTTVATMEELAARMVPRVLESHPAGPIMLAGWSLAGVVAIEVAAQLERAGREVPFVVLFDSLSPVRQRQYFSSSPRIRQWQLNFVKARYHVEEALTRGPGEAMRHLWSTYHDARARREYDRVLRETAVGRTRQFDVPLDFRQAFGVYAVKYSPAPLCAKVIVVRPERQKRGAFYAGDLGWAELGYDVDLVIVPGDHERMFMGGNAAILAERLLERIDATRRKTGAS